MDRVAVRSWPGEPNPSAESVRAVVKTEGHSFYDWSNGPGDRYATHTHAYDKLLYCLRGSITFVLPLTGERCELFPGDRMELPAGTPHSAEVGNNGVLCCEAHL